MKKKPVPQPGKTIRLKITTVERLDKIKQIGQSYDGIVQSLMNSYTKNPKKPNIP